MRAPDISNLNTTSWRIVGSVVTACALITLSVIAVLFFGFKPDDSQRWLLMGAAGVLLMMMGFDLTQFITKRVTDIGYQQSKREAPPIVENAEQVTVSEPKLEDTKVYEIVPQMRGESLVRRESEKGE